MNMESKEEQELFSITTTNPTTNSTTRESRWWSEETVAVVTGGNRGIGFAVVKRLAELGLTVILTARDRAKGEEALNHLISSSSSSSSSSFRGETRRRGRVQFYPLDVSEPASIAKFSSWFHHNFGHLDILVNNAAVSCKEDIYDNTVEQAEVVMRTNYYGPKLLIRALFPFFRRSPSTLSRILNITSRLALLNKMENREMVEMLLGDEERVTEEWIERAVVGGFLEDVKSGEWEKKGWPKVWTDYAVSKLALNAYSKLLAKAFHGLHLSVNCYCPGFTRTSMTRGRGTRSPEAAAAAIATLALLPPQHLPTGQFYLDSSSSPILRTRL